MSKILKIKIILIVLSLLILPSFVGAFSVGDVEKFYVEKGYDLYQREEVSAILVRITNKLLFYVEKEWWERLEPIEKGEIAQTLLNLSDEFERKIEPKLTATFGDIPKHPVDKSGKVSVLFHQMRKDVGGYFNSGDQYIKLQYPRSNEKNLLYLNIARLEEPILPAYLAHEFVHLITFNQKEILRNVSEETWLNEARAEYAPTLLGYDDVYKGSNLEKRVKIFLEKPSDSLTEWRNRSPDYGVVNLFIQYLVDHYGLAILRDSLWSSETGIASLNYALRKNGHTENFSQIFTNWTIAVLVNDCSLGSKYCYWNPNLKNLRIVPESNFLPITAAETSLSIHSQIKDWSGKWQKIFGGKGNLVLKFNGRKGVNFKVPYVLCDYAQKCAVKFLNLDKQRIGEIIIPEFSSKYSSLTLIPSVQNKLSGFTDNEPVYLFSWEVRTKELAQDDPEIIKKLLEQIAALKKEIARVQAEINAILASRGQKITCGRFERNLYFGMRNNAEVKCLQEFLRNQGPEIYPQGLITGNFLTLTKSAIIRFQEKYASEILAPLGLKRGTGYVGLATRNKINQLLNF